MNENKKKVDKKTLDAEITKALTDDFDRFEHFALTKWKHIAWSGVLIIVAVAAVCSVTAWLQATDQKAVSTICDAKTTEEIQKALTEYPDHEADISARLRLAEIYFKKKDYKNVLEQYDLADKMNIPEQLRWRLALNRGYIYELQKDYPKAISAFAAVSSDSFIGQDYRCEANYAAGRIAAQTEKWSDAAKYLSLSKNAVNPQNNSFAIDFYKRQADFLYQRLSANGKIKIPALPVKTVIKPVAASTAKSQKPEL